MSALFRSVEVRSFFNGLLTQDSLQSPTLCPSSGQSCSTSGNVLGDIHLEIAGSLGILGDLSSELEEYEAAKSYFEQALAVQTQLFEADDWHVVDTRLKRDDMLLRAKLTTEDRATLTEAARLMGASCWRRAPVLSR